jgi:hypothetical protein
VTRIAWPLALNASTSSSSAPAAPETTIAGPVPEVWETAAFVSFGAAPDAALNVSVLLMATPAWPLIWIPPTLNVAPAYVPGETANVSPGAAAVAASSSDPHARSAPPHGPSPALTV